jgi:uncharacterized BrkB/YihY/UPF0761 family membrane protein
MRRILPVLAMTAALLSVLAGPALAMPAEKVHTDPGTTMLAAVVIAILVAALVLADVYRRMPKGGGHGDAHHG